MGHSTEQDLAFRDWADRARAVAVVDALALLPHGVKRRGNQMVGPCPACGGHDRFSVHLARNLWHCRASKKGGDAIALIQYVEGVDFLGAVERLTGEACPTGEKGQKPDLALMQKRRENAEAQARQREIEALDYRSREQNRARDIWRQAEDHSAVTQAYLAKRGLDVPDEADLRGQANQKYWHYNEAAKAFEVLHTGPAMIAAIRNGAGRIEGCHITYIDLATKTAKAAVVDPATGEVLDAKKVRGSQRGGRIHLGGHFGAASLVIGEGIETVLSVRQAMLAHGRDISDFMFWAAVNLGNMGGAAAKSVFHPTLKRKDSRGLERRVKVAGPVPKYDSAPCLMPPDYAREMILLMDGDSDGFTTSQVMLRAAARFQAPGRKVRIARADSGFDFNDMWRAA